MNVLERAYKDLIKDDLKAAARRFKSVAQYGPRAKWGLFLTQLLQGGCDKNPTYFQVRNFLEIDLQFLIDNKKGEYVEKILGYADFFFTVNPESYKFLARVMSANKFYDPARFFIERARQRLYNDPELHFIIAQTEMALGNKDAASKALSDCLEILPGYHPAVKMKSQLGNLHI